MSNGPMRCGLAATRRRRASARRQAGATSTRSREGSGMSPDAITTEIDIAGANCPWCFNETLDRLRAEPGVVDARASMRGQCLRIEHRGLPTQALVGLDRRNRHGAALPSSDPGNVENAP